MKDDSPVRYSRWIGFIYVFNLIVGTGALAMPKAFQSAGWLFSGMILTLLCFFSYVTTTFVIESMSITNGLARLAKLKHAPHSDAFPSTGADDDTIKTMYPSPADEVEVVKRSYGTIQENANQVGQSLENILPIKDEIKSIFEITETFEMGGMAMKYFNRFGLVLFYLSMCIYLYGDLAVYSAAVPISIRDIACTYRLNHSNFSNGAGYLNINRSLANYDPCWYNSTITRMNAYRIFLTAFIVLLCPFVFFNLTKTKFLQIATLSMRWFAFGIMFVLMAVYLSSGNKHGSPPPIDLALSPNLFGICVYAFMCHHSLPSLITPINKKNRIYLLLLVNFVLILGFYLCLSYLSSFTFIDIKSLITLNFKPDQDYRQPPITSIAFFQYYLLLFPVFSLSSNFPIIGITLRNNLKNLITCGTGRSFQSKILDKLLYPLLALIPPIIVVYSTDNVQFMVGFTGSYAGSVIQYIVPISLVICARKQMMSLLSTIDDDALTKMGLSMDQLKQTYISPFHHLAWAALIILWTVISIIFVTVNHIVKV